MKNIVRLFHVLRFYNLNFTRRVKEQTALLGGVRVLNIKYLNVKDSRWCEQRLCEGYERGITSNYQGVLV